MENSSKTVGAVEAAEMLGICRVTAYKLIHNGDIPSIRVGKKLRIPIQAIDNMLSNTGRVQEELK